MAEPVQRAADIKVEPVGTGSGVRRQVLTRPGEGSGFHMRRFSIGPGGGMPRHKNRVEHQQIVLGGSAEVGIGDEVYHVSVGDVVHIPGGTPHWYRTAGERAFEFLCVVPDDDDRLEILEDEGEEGDPAC